MNSTADLPDDVARFVAEVRAHLADLPPEQVEDLTDGLEADLVEGLADDDTVRPPWMDDPAAFADELRTAAGLPPGNPDGDRRARPPLRRRGRALVHRVAARTRSSSWGRWTGGLAVLLRPAWWVLRAVVAVVFLGGALLAGATAAVLIALVILPFAIYASVELGRGRWAFPWRRAAVFAGNTLAGIGAIVLGLALLARTSAPAPYETVLAGVPRMDGVWVNGNQAVNLFPYDAEGRPLRDVQLFDQDGNPVDIGQPERAYTVTPDGTLRGPVPATDVYGQQRWNSYPLRTTVIEPGTEPGTDLPRPQPTGTAEDAVPPLTAVPPIQTTTPTPTSPTPTATPSPTRS
jgi:hypothetical protein